MKSPEINPLAAGEEAVEEGSPAPVNREPHQGQGDDSGSGRGQVPIAVSDGDFSTPAVRKRTITRPRGLKTLEQLASSPQTPPTVEILTAAPGGISGPEIPPVPAREPPFREPSVVDEFLAAPPTPAPESEATPPPDSSLVSPLIGAHLDGIESVGAAVEMGRAALAHQTRDDDGGRQHPPGREPNSEAGSALGGPQSDLDRTNVDDLGEQASVQRSLSADGPATASQPAPSAEWRVSEASPEVPLVDSIAAALAQPHEQAQQRPQQQLPEQLPGTVRPSGFEMKASVAGEEDVLANVGERAPPAGGDDVFVVTAEDAALTAVPRATQDSPLQATQDSSVEISESDMSPLAQTLAHMAEAMHADIPIESELEIEIVDGPLVPMLGEGWDQGVPVRRRRDPVRHLARQRSDARLADWWIGPCPCRRWWACQRLSPSVPVARSDRNRGSRRCSTKATSGRCRS